MKAYVKISLDSVPLRTSAAGRPIYDLANFRAIEYTTTDDILEAVTGERGFPERLRRFETFGASHHTVLDHKTGTHTLVLMPDDTSYPPVPRDDEEAGRPDHAIII